MRAVTKISSMISLDSQSLLLLHLMLHLPIAIRRRVRIYHTCPPDLSMDEAPPLTQKVHSKYSDVTESKMYKSAVFPGFHFMFKIVLRMDGWKCICRTGVISLGKVNNLMGLFLLLIGMIRGVPKKIDLSDLRCLLSGFLLGSASLVGMTSFLSLDVCLLAPTFCVDLGY